MPPLVVPSTIELKENKFFSVIQTKCWCTKAWKSCFAKRALLQHLGATLRGTSCNAWCPLGEEDACRGGGRGWFSEMFLRNGSQKCFSETVLEMFLRNGSQKGQMGLQRHRWQERQRIKKGQAGPLKHSLSMKWENKETKRLRFCQGMFDLGGIIFSTSRDQIRGEWQSIDPYYHRSSRLSLLPWLLSTTIWFPAIIILLHKVRKGKTFPNDFFLKEDGRCAILQGM